MRERTREDQPIFPETNRRRLSRIGDVRDCFPAWLFHFWHRAVSEADRAAVSSLSRACSGLVGNAPISIRV